MHIEPITPENPEVQKLIQALDAYQSSLYPEESNHLDNIDTLKQSNVVMFGAWDSDGLGGIGAIKFMEGYGEIKRMFVPKSHRKKGIAKKLLQSLEHSAMAKGLTCIRLETGIYQKEAIGLYQYAGFKEIKAFGNYQEDPLSLFMEKELPPLFQVLSISPYTGSDHDQVISLWQACGLIVPWNDPDKDIERKLNHSPELFFLARLEDQVIGSCMAGYDGHRGGINYLGVRPEFQKNGVAGKLIAHSEKTLLGLGCPKINLMVRKTNAGVIDFYKNSNYKDDPVLVLGKRLESDL
jgi:ribosomal protein S18 acetylase RimI-like enzyme